MPQIQGLGLDQSQLADVINQQYVGYSQRQRNQMMQSAAATPDNWSSITQQANNQAQQPTEYLAAGRTSDIPTVSQDGQTLTGYDPSNINTLYNQNPNYQNTPFDYTDSSGKGYYNLNTQNKIEATAPNFISGSHTSFDQNPTQAGGYYFSDPWGFSHPLNKVNSNTYFAPESSLNQHTKSGTADTYFGFDTSKNLSGLYSGSYNGQRGVFFNPHQTNLSSLLSPGRNNTAYAKQGGDGILGALNDITNNFDPLGNFITNTDAHNLGYNNRLDMVQNLGEPVGNILGAIFSGGVPWGSIAMGAQNASTGNWNAVGQNALSGLASYAGSNIASSGTGGAPVDVATDSASGAAANGMAGSSGGIFNSGLDLGSTYANQAGQNLVINAAKNYAQTGDMENALKAAAFSTAANGTGNWLGNATDSALGEIGSKALGGAASGGLNSLFTQNSPVNGSLFGALSGGLYGFLNSTDKQNQTFNQQQNNTNAMTANSVAKLARLFAKK